MALQGNTILTLSRDKDFKHIIKKIEKHNAITPWVQNAIGKGNFHAMMDGNNIMPIKQWFSGCLLTDHTNDALLQMIAGNSEVTAQAGNNSYTTGANLKRGSFNTNESGKIAGGYRFVWDWLTNQGNGQIASVCLTRHQMGIAEYYSSDTPADEAVINERVSFGDYYETDKTNLGLCIVIDYAKKRGYSLSYDSGTITIGEYRISTDIVYLVDNRFSAELISTHTISQTVQQYSLSTASVSYTGDKLHLLTFQSNTGNLYDYSIDTTAWTVTATSHIYSGVSFTAFGNYRTVLPMKDALPIIGDYVYSFSNSNSKIVKCNLLGNNDADVTSYDNPWGDALDNGEGVVLANGDFYKFSRQENTRCVYYHNGVFYKAKSIALGQNTSYSAVGVQANAYGTQLITNYNGLTNISYARLTTMFPYVSTVNNLEETVTKDVTMYMKLTYELTEVAS